MKSYRCYINILVLFVGLNFVKTSKAQNAIHQTVDSLFAIADTLPDDSLKIERISNMAWDYRRSNPQLSKFILDTAEYILNNEIEYEFIKIRLEFIRSDLYKSEGREDKVISSLNKCIEWYKQYLNHESPQVAKNATYSISACYNQLADAYSNREQYLQAANLFHESLRYIKNLKDSSKISTAFWNLGFSHLYLENIDSAEYYFAKSFDVESQLNDPIGLYYAHYGFAQLYLQKKEFEKGIDNVNKALEYAAQYGDQSSKIECYQILGQIHLEQGNYQIGIWDFQEALSVCYELNFSAPIPYILSQLSELHKLNGDYQKALKFHEKYSDLKDSLLKFSSEEKLAQYQSQFESEKKEQQIAILQADKQIQENKNRLLILGIIAAIVVIILVFVQFIANRKAKLRLLDKNKVIRAKNKDIHDKNLQITDSLDYARGIQKAVLPDKELLNELFEDNFLLYQPKDIVSGDFYWFKRVGDTVVFAVGDCTGHGVPGAFMSIVCMNLLEEIIKESIVDPVKILNQLSKRLIIRLRQADTRNSIKDGLDIAICSLDITNNKLCFSGAHNPLYIIRNKELMEFKGDAIHIGINKSHNKEFTVKEVELSKGDQLFMFSDGYVDQKGGPKGKKFYYKPFRNLLLENSNLAMQDQMSALSYTFEKWKGEFEQIDDVCVIGVRV